MLAQLKRVPQVTPLPSAIDKPYLILTHGMMNFLFFMRFQLWDMNQNGSSLPAIVNVFLNTEWFWWSSWGSRSVGHICNGMHTLGWWSQHSCSCHSHCSCSMYSLALRVHMIWNSNQPWSLHCISSYLFEGCLKFNLPVQEFCNSFS